MPTERKWIGTFFPLTLWQDYPATLLPGEKNLVEIMGVHVAGTAVPGSDLVPLGATGLWCRGPLDAGEGAVVFVGGSETQGRFVVHPFPSLLAGLCGGAVNLGVAHAGLDCLSGLPAFGRLGVQGRCVVLQVPCAANLSNGYYRVHPRRNDRFLAPTSALRRLFPEVDYSEFAFVRALLLRLQRVHPERFDTLVTGLQAAWNDGMRGLLKRWGGDVRLLWLQGRGAFGAEPAFVTEAMVRALGHPVYRVATGIAGVDTSGMVFAPDDRAAAQAMPGPEHHRAIARALLPIFGGKEKGPP